MGGGEPLQWLAGTQLIRRLADTFFRGRARRHLATLDHQNTVRSQVRILRGLVHRGHATRFGREHDFRRIRTPGDFQRLVPLRTPLDFWQEYWGPAFPQLADVTWPGPVLEGAVRGTVVTPHIPSTAALWTGHRAAAWTALAMVVAARPQARLFSGQLLLLGDLLPGEAGTKTTYTDLFSLGFDLSSILLQPASFVFPSRTESLQTVVEHTIRAPLTCLAGGEQVLTRFFALSKKETGWRQAADIWPGLTAVLYQRAAGSPGSEQLMAEVGFLASGRAPVAFLEACFRAEGAIAVEDPRYGRLRLLADHGVYFEFVSDEERSKSRPVRQGIDEVKLGVPYTLILTSAAGLWACLTEIRLCFENRDPPLIRLLETPPLEAPANQVVKDLVRSNSSSAPHQRNGGLETRHPVVSSLLPGHR